MASYTIHIAIANEMIKKNNNLYNKEEFLKGAIAPDLIEDKAKTHFAEDSQDSNLEKFLENYSLDNGYYSGCFLHLLVDRLFYNYYLNDWSSRKNVNDEKLYSDYYGINKSVIKKYKVPIVEEVKEYMMPRRVRLNYLKIKTLYKFIDRVSDINLEEYAKKVKNCSRS